MRTVLVSDCTLNSIAREGDVSLLFREKTAIASCLSSFGVDVIGLAPVKSLKEDVIICKTLASFVDAVLSIPAGTTKESITEAWECVKSAKKPCLEIELPVSTLQMEYVFHMKADKMLKKIAELVSYARSLCDNVLFTAADATRAEGEFLLNACRTAEESGATSVCLCDTAGTFLPDEFSAMVRLVKSSLSLPVFAMPSDAISLGTANALAAISAGADGIRCGIYGSDTVKTGDLASALEASEEKINAKTGLKFSEIRTDIDTLLSKIGLSEKSVLPTPASDAEDICLDENSTVSEVAQAATVLGYDLSDKDVGDVYEALQLLCKSKYTIGKKEFEAVIASSAMQVPSTYHLLSYTTLSSNKTTSTAHIILGVDDERYEGLAAGNGPIDAAFKAIEQSIGCRYELDAFELQSVTEGKEALGSALVRLRSAGKLYSGTGLSADIVGASIRAYVNALNKIVYENRK